MTAIVIDSVDKPKVDDKALVEYSKEIAPIVRAIAHQKELLKDFKESDETAAELTEAVAEAQAALKKYLDENDDAIELSESIKSLENDLKQAISAAAKISVFKKPDLKAFFTARPKEKAVTKVIIKGNVFEQLEEVLK